MTTARIDDRFWNSVETGHATCNTLEGRAKYDETRVGLILAGQLWVLDFESGRSARRSRREEVEKEEAFSTNDFVRHCCPSISPIHDSNRLGAISDNLIPELELGLGLAPHPARSYAEISAHCSSLKQATPQGESGWNASQKSG
jgi:hypothetical protein